MSAVEFLKGVLIKGIHADIEQLTPTAKCDDAISVAPRQIHLMECTDNSDPSFPRDIAQYAEDILGRLGI
jgi:hypothetical protein